MICIATMPRKRRRKNVPDDPLSDANTDICDLFRRRLYRLPGKR
jgi:hypothetical protein